MGRRRALPPTAEQEAQRAANRAEGSRLAAPVERVEYAVTEAVARWFYVVSRRGVFGHAQGEHAELTLTDGQAAALVAAGHISDSPAPAVVEPVEVEDPTPVVLTKDDDNQAASADVQADSAE
jgi:hypothetical protein